MAIFIKATIEYEYHDNGITVTQTQICQDCTTCPFLFSGSGNTPIYSSEYLAYIFQVEGGLCDSARDFLVFYDAFGTIGNRFQIICDNVVLWETGCITSSGSATMTIPAGTMKFEARVYGACNNLPNDVWAFSGGCV